MRRHVQEEAVLAGIGQVVFKGPAEPGLLVKIGIIDIEIALDTLKALEKVKDRGALRFFLRRPPEAFDDKERGIGHGITFFAGLAQ